MAAEAAGPVAEVDEVDDDFNAPVLVERGGERRLYVFASLDGGGQCTARTRKGRRCRNDAWEEGQLSLFSTRYVGDRVLHIYGPLPVDRVERYLEQRCPVHDTPDAVDACAPEWELFDPERHSHLYEAATMELAFGRPAEYLPPVAILAAALRSGYGPEDRRAIVDVLLADDAVAAGAAAGAAAEGPEG